MNPYRPAHVSRVDGLRRTDLAAIAVIAIIGFLVSGCGSTSPTASAAPTTGGALTVVGGTSSAPTAGAAGASHDLCSLLTQTEIAAALGTSVGAGNELNDGHMCSWANDTTGIDASIADGTGGADYDGICTVSDVSVVKVDGVGDAACYLVAGNLATSLEFKKKSASYAVAITLPDATVRTVESAEKALALEAAARI